MNSDRSTIYRLLAAGRIDAAQAERLLAAASAERESLWILAGCAALAGLAQLHWLGPPLLHLFREVLAAGVPALHHTLTSLSVCLGGLS